jgi:hypothetical protein
MRGLLNGPSTDDVPFDWPFVNYAPLVMAAICIALWVGWHLSAKKWFTGPKHTIDLPVGSVLRPGDLPRAPQRGPAAR